MWKPRPSSTSSSELGVKPVINARGHNTVLGGATPSAAHARRRWRRPTATTSTCSELLERPGEIIAGLLECEAAYVTPGAAAALALGTAACITGDDIEKMARLPDTAGLKNRVLIQAGHRYQYERTVTIVGTKLVEVGDRRRDDRRRSSRPRSDRRRRQRALPGPPRRHAGHALARRGARDRARQGRAGPGRRGRRRSTRSSACSRYTKRGADLVAFGSKYFGGPNSAGILAARRRSSTRRCRRASSASRPSPTARASAARSSSTGRRSSASIGRAAGVARRSTTTAAWPARSSGSGRSRGRSRGLPGVSTEVVKSDGAAPRVLRIAIDPAAAKTGRQRRRRRTARRQPLDRRQPDRHALVINVSTVHEGDEDVIGRRLRELLG